jgi:F-type H+-transporting ATPase subunit epsilon
MPAIFHANIILLGKVVYQGDISSMIVPAERGYLGVLAHHAPIIARLNPGKITLRDSIGKTMNFILNGNGFLEVSGNTATLLVDSLELPS